MMSKVDNQAKCISVASGSTQSPANLQMYDYGATNDQGWVLEKSNLDGKNPGTNYPAIRYNGQVYFNYTNAINSMLQSNTAEAKNHKLLMPTEYAAIVAVGTLINGPIGGLTFGSGMYASYQAAMFYWFFNQVNHGANWDVKVSASWSSQLSIPFISRFYYNGNIWTPADLGNYMYGYLGRAMKIGADMLYWGGGVAHVRNIYYGSYGTVQGYVKACTDSRTFAYPYGDLPEDTTMIAKGIAAFNQANPNYGTAVNFAPDKIAQAAFQSFVSQFTDLFRTNPL